MRRGCQREAGRPYARDQDGRRIDFDPARKQLAAAEQLADVYDNPAAGGARQDSPVILGAQLQPVEVKLRSIPAEGRRYAGKFDVISGLRMDPLFDLGLQRLHPVFRAEFAAPWSQDPGDGKGRQSAYHLNDARASTIQEAPLREPSASPCPMCKQGEGPAGEKCSASTAGAQTPAVRAAAQDISGSYNVSESRAFSIIAGLVAHYGD